jgi:hypothetical protein
MFAVTRTDYGLALEGIHGQAWERLSFTCPPEDCRQDINQYGMSD